MNTLAPKIFIYEGEKKICRSRQVFDSCCYEKKEKIRDTAIEFKGGKCNICGYDKCNAALEFHHIDKRKKDFGLSMNGITRSWEKTKKELEKCILACSNCHREIHSGITQLFGESRIEK